jgi:hypothetical protein
MNPPTYYRTRAARQAYTSHGERYAQYIENHTLSLIKRGKLPESAIDQNLGERLAGNDAR